MPTQETEMCEFFVKADPIQYEQRSRTVRIRGVLTSLRLENMVWDVLAEMAEREARTTNALISQFHDEILAHRGEVPNFASFLRVTCMRYLRRAAHEAELAAEHAADQSVMGAGAGAGAGPGTASSRAAATSGPSDSVDSSPEAPAPPRLAVVGLSR
jgi:predicted DNA-binding ribbon-helix-helix protein